MPSGTMAQQIALRIWSDHRATRTVAFHPTCHLEIHEQNLRPYPYDADEVRAHIEGLGYALEELGRAEFVARPR